eukprot:CAMPEP_0201716180 /NCGR_PEP_ID=MMETSP0593-20130828/2205_1 /ASSEMBLY_ACC=CAM_ASM_000672 /TAXON_ID=267983 /ORGANISM="Skeletonema japonicum, Strain CCMP2506" /LENGTH=31 /DNA_ID= /DNA_START= /DNA_END= /DNA_ORIENTATION=
MTDDFSDVGMLKECPRTNDGDGHENMSCLIW